jgi:hypothetical protein
MSKSKGSRGLAQREGAGEAVTSCNLERSNNSTAAVPLHPKIVAIKRGVAPGTWEVELERYGEIGVTTGTLRSYRAFHLRCMEKFCVVFGMMRKAEWLARVEAAMSRLREGEQ